MSGLRRAALLSAGLMAALAGGCAPLGIDFGGDTEAPAESGDRRPDPVEVRLADAAERAEAALTALARVRAAEAPPPAPGPPAEVPGYSPVPAALRRAVTLDWIGPVEVLAGTLAARAGYRFAEAGAAPARPVMVAVAAKNAPLIEVLRDAGLQAGAAATLIVDAGQRTVRLDWTPAAESGS